MKKQITDSDLFFRYPDEKELIAWYESLNDLLQQEYDYEYQARIPSWHMFLRQKRYDLDNELTY